MSGNGLLAGGNKPDHRVPIAVRVEARALEDYEPLWSGGAQPVSFMEPLRGSR